MITALRDYQQELYLKAKEALIKNRAICIQSATGSGKSIIFSAMCESVFKKGKSAWIIVTRRELLKQSSDHLRKWNVPHGIISANSNESKAYKIHIVSSDTLIRRFDKIKNWPALIIFDEAHLMLDRQIKIIEHLSKNIKIIGFTATPQRGDSRGLSIQANGVYDKLIEGPSIPWLTERGFLAPLKYFAPPLEGIDKLHFHGTEVDAEELELLLQRKKIYGKVVDHYETNGKGRFALIFCRSIKSAEHTAEQFRNRGFKFYNIDGKMSMNKRYNLVESLKKGEIQGLCGADIFIYGLDFPRVSYGAIIRPTRSRSVYMQAIGRIIRPFTDPITGEQKKDALFFDHCNNILEHQDLNYPGIPLHYIPHITWNFHGTEKRKRKKEENNIRLCPLNDFMYCNKPSCHGCLHNPDTGDTPDPRKPMIVIPAQLEELKKPVPMNERPPEERRELQDRIGRAIMDYKNGNKGAVAELSKIQESLGYNVLWIYWKLTEENRLTTNLPVLHEIAQVKGYKPQWVHFITKKVKFQKQIKEDYKEAMHG